MATARVGHAESGFTLVELLVTVVILGVAFAVFVGGMGTSVLSSEYQRQQTSVEVVLRDFAEAVKQRATYTTCAPQGSYATVAAPSGTTWPPTSKFTREVTAITYWNGSTYASSCTVDKGLQKISLRVRATSGRASGTLDVIKRQP